MRARLAGLGQPVGAAAWRVTLDRAGQFGLPGGQLAEGGPVTEPAGPPPVIDVAAVDDHRVILEGLPGWVAAPGSGIRVIGTAVTVAALLAGPGRAANVVLLDLDLGDGSTAEQNVARIRRGRPSWCCPRRTGPARSRRDPGRRARLCAQERGDGRGPCGY